jgi:hypothetical protein
MGILQTQDRVAATLAGAQGLEELPSLRTVPWGYYLKRDRGIGRLQATRLFQDYYRKAKGHEFLCLEAEYPRDTVEACVYLRATALLEPAVEPTPTVQPKKKRNKRKKKGGK